MSSPLRRILKPERFDRAFWLPPGGIENGIFATYWAELADLEAGDVDPVLDRLAEADVAGYVATPRGTLRRDLHENPIRRLWVDSLQYHRAEDVLMAYLNQKHPTGQSHSGTTS